MRKAVVAEPARNRKLNRRAPEPVEEGHPGDSRQRRGPADQGAFEPEAARPLPEHEQGRRQREGEQEQGRPIPSQPLARDRRPRQEGERECGEGGSGRGLDEEQGLPAGAVLDPGGQGRAEIGRQQQRQSEHRQPPGQPRAGGGHEGGDEGDRPEAAGREALQRAKADLQRQPGSDRAADRGQRENRRARRHVAPEAEAGDQRRGKHDPAQQGHGVSGRQPRTFVGGDAEAALDVGEIGADELARKVDQQGPRKRRREQ
jgi:hypothetical protein